LPPWPRPSARAAKEPRAIATDESQNLPIIESRHLKDEAYRTIKSAILQLNFRPGDAVMEGKLARSLRISKTPVRNALVRLEQEGLVETRPFRGTFVTPLTVRNIREIFQVRRVLEELAMQLVLMSSPPGTADRLLALVDEAPAQLHAGQLEASFDAIRDFHEELVRLSGNEWLIKVYGTFADHLSRIRNVCGHIPGRVEKSASEHRAIVDALARGDHEEGGARLGLHLDSLVDDYLQADGVVSLQSADA
jgi:GntR family transcriptional regulator, rspAB operon transcriptional repressor